ncbi:hypothetical protein Hdeb2414_s0041g00738611 [Helianthus debilis subsp. tardiflorus]
MIKIPKKSHAHKLSLSLCYTCEIEELFEFLLIYSYAGDLNGDILKICLALVQPLSFEFCGSSYTRLYCSISVVLF